MNKRIIKPDLDWINRCRQQFGLLPIPTSEELIRNAKAIFVETWKAAMSYIIDHEGQLPPIPFPEFYYYKRSYRLNPNYSVFLIGTFHTLGYQLDLLSEVQLAFLIKPTGTRVRRPKIDFPHGQNCGQWKVLEPALIPRTINDGNRAKVKDAVVQYMEGIGINYFDVIDACQRLEYNAADNNLVNILPNLEALRFLLTHKFDNPVLIFNTSSTFCADGLGFGANGAFEPGPRSFDIFLSIALELNTKIAFSLDIKNWLNMVPENAFEVNRLMRKKLIFYMKLNEKVFTVVAGVSPSNATLNLGANAVYQKYCRLGHQPDKQSFKRLVYQNAVQKNFGVLWPLNVL